MFLQQQQQLACNLDHENGHQCLDVEVRLGFGESCLEKFAISVTPGRVEIYLR